MKNTNTLDLSRQIFLRLSSNARNYFRPFHEHNGDWVLVGIGLTLKKTIFTLWRFYNLNNLRAQNRVN